MGREEIVTVTRHPIEHRIWHWVFFVTMGLLVLTGSDMYLTYSMFGYSIYGGFGLARSWHIMFALLAAFWAYPIFLYIYGVTGELKELMPSTSDIAFFVDMTRNFLGLSTYYPEHSTYDVRGKRYYKKYNPGQKLVYGGILVFLLLQGITGLAMFWSDKFSFVISILGGIVNVRALHLGLMYAILGLVAMHIYMAVIPPNWGSLKSMFIGRASERVHGSPWAYESVPSRAETYEPTKSGLGQVEVHEEPGRLRIIPHIESLDQAIKVETDVQSAYHAVIEDNISYWWAVEEDVIDSYTSLINKTENEKVRSTLSRIIEDSRNHVEALESMRESFRKMLADEQRHAKMLKAISQE
jgi:Ni/Fe-hydrogenase 1 B-type cytochrome subunit